MDLQEFLCDLLHCEPEEIREHIAFQRFPDRLAIYNNLGGGGNTELLPAQPRSSYFIKMVTLDLDNTIAGHTHAILHGFVENYDVYRVICGVYSYGIETVHKDWYPHILCKAGKGIETEIGPGIDCVWNVLFKEIPDSYLGRIA